MSKEAIVHLRRDKKLARVIDGVGELKLKKGKDIYLALLQSIVSQQLSVKAAATIWQRFLLLFPYQYPDSDEILKMNSDILRSVGLSGQKANYIQHIADSHKKNHFEPSTLKKMKDDDLINHLVQIKGVGKWTAQMVLIFTMGREDVFPHDDLGIQNGMKSLYGLSSDKKVLIKEMSTIAEKWRPYRSLASKYIWKYKDAL